MRVDTFNQTGEPAPTLALYPNGYGDCVRTHDDLLEIMEGVCADVQSSAVGASEVAERLVLVTESGAAVRHEGGETIYDSGGVIAFVNDSGVPFVEQGPDFMSRTKDLHPTAVLLGGSALTGRPGSGFRKVLAVQLFSVEHDIRMTRIAPVDKVDGAISSVGQWRDVKTGPPMWAEKLLE